MTGDQQRLLEAILRTDFDAFVDKVFGHIAPNQQLRRSWYMRAIAYQLARCLRGDVRRLIITLPPRHLKSVMASVAFPAFILGHDPAARIVCASYSAELAGKHASDCRSVMASDWYRRTFPGTRLSDERRAKADFMTTSRGYRMSTSVGGTLTGRGGNWVIVDDSLKAEDALSEAKRDGTNEWFDNTLYTRLDNKSTDVMIVIMQRLHIDDLVGHLLGKGEGWVHLDLPAIAEVDADIEIGPGRFHHRKVGDLLSPEREPMTVLDDLKRTLGNFSFSAQYQQRPIPPEGEIIQWGWFGRFEPRRHQGRAIFQSWDTAHKDGELNDYSVCTTWAVIDNKFYLLHVFRKKMLYPELKRAVVDGKQSWGAGTILIEDRGAGTTLIQELRYSLGCNVIPIEPEGDKVLRASAASTAIEAGRVFLPVKALWLDELQREVLQFPAGRHDDQIDSIAQFLGWWEKRKRTSGVMMVPVSGI